MSDTNCKGILNLDSRNSTEMNFGQSNCGSSNSLFEVCSKNLAELKIVKVFFVLKRSNAFISIIRTLTTYILNRSFVLLNTRLLHLRVSKKGKWSARRKPSRHCVKWHKLLLISHYFFLFLAYFHLLLFTWLEWS